MAWNKKYVSSQATGGGDGSSTNPWTIEEGFQNLAAGMALHIINDGTYSPTATLAPGTALATYDPPALIVGCNSDLSIVTDFPQLPVIDFAGLASGNGIDFNSSASYSVFLYGLDVRNAPTDNIFLYRYSGAFLCRAENAGYAGIRANGYCSAIYCKAVNSSSYGFYLPVYSCAAFCMYEGTDPPAASGIQAQYAIACHAKNALTNIRTNYHGGAIAFSTVVDDAASGTPIGFSHSHNVPAFGNLCVGTDKGLAVYAGMLAAFNHCYNVTTPVSNQDASGEGPFEVGTDTTTDPQFNDAAAGDYRPTNKDLQSLFDILKQNPGAFPFLAKGGGWKPRPRLHGV